MARVAAAELVYAEQLLPQRPSHRFSVFAFASADSASFEVSSQPITSRTFETLFTWCLIIIWQLLSVN